MLKLQLALKWLLDRVGALLLLVVLSPVACLSAAWVLLDDGRPIVFVQERVGRHGRRFRMFKFRTMVRDAVRLGQEQRITTDPFGVVHNDPRVTASGRFLRRTGLDELPQLVNVLCGRMSLVGPRPDIPEQVAGYSERDRRRLEVRPGITGFSQVYGRDEIPWPQRISQDIEYIDTWSLVLDLRLLLLTVLQVFRPEPSPLADDGAVTTDRQRSDEC